MSTARTPVAIVYLPNQPYLLGTFDTTNFSSWWKSKPFPDDIEYIKKGMHVFGRSHLAIAKRVDGRWAVYLSKNYGVDWERVFLAEVDETIYNMILIKSGWVILNTSDGFYQSTKAGYSGTWSKISDLPGASAVPAFCNIGSGDILLCTNGRYIWRSTNKAVSWTLVCDQATVGGRRWYKQTQEIRDNGFRWTYGSPLTAAIDGANGEVLCAYGPFITVSRDYGLTWTDTWNPIAGWVVMNYWDGWITFVRGSPPKSVIYDRFPTSATSAPNFVVKQIIVSSVKGPLMTDVCYVVRVDDLVPAPGQTKLFSRVFYGYHGQYWSDYHNTYGDDISPAWQSKFQQNLSPDDNLNQLSAYENAVLGSTDISRLIVSAQTTVDVNGDPIPSFKYSKNGGKDWTTVDLSKVKIADGENLPIFSGAFLDDNYAKGTWISSYCDNFRNLIPYGENEHTQTQSYELDSEIEGWRTLTEDLQIDAVVVKIGEENDSVDAIVAKDQDKPYDVDLLAEGEGSKTYRIDRGIEDEVEKTESVDAIASIDNTKDDSVDAILQKNQRFIYKIGVGLHDQNSKTYQVGVKVVRDGLIQRLSRIERLSPQMLDLYLPYVPYNPYDSAWEYI